MRDLGPPPDDDGFDGDEWGPPVVMQPRCVRCKREQWAVVVAWVSRGLARCAWCGQHSPVFTNESDYRAALAAPKLEP